MTKFEITTKGGDKGTTSLGNGTRVPKDDPRVELYGTLDECQAHIGMARAICPFEELKARLLAMEEDLGQLMGYLALYPGLRPPSIAELEDVVEHVKRLLDGKPAFVKPGDSTLGAALHIARTVARRAERLAVRLARASEIDDATYAYLNRLSDAIYAMALWADRMTKDMRSATDIF